MTQPQIYRDLPETTAWGLTLRLEWYARALHKTHGEDTDEAFAACSQEPCASTCALIDEALAVLAPKQGHPRPAAIDPDTWRTPCLAPSPPSKHQRPSLPMPLNATAQPPGTEYPTR